MVFLGSAYETARRWQWRACCAWLGMLSLFLGGACTRELQTETPIRLVFKHPRLLSNEAPLRALLDQFRREHPSLQVDEEVLPSSSDQQHLFYVTNLEAEASDFDVFALDVIWIPEFRRASWLVNLTPHLKPGELDDFLAAPVRAATHNGRMYAMPWFADAGALYYRRDLLDKYGFAPPQTVTALTHIAQRILHGERNPQLTGFVWQGKQYEGLMCVALEFMRAYGGGILDEHGSSLLTHPATVAGLQALYSLIAHARVSPSLVTTADEELARHIFTRGEAVFMRNWPYAWSLLDADGSPVQGRVGVTAVPGTVEHSGVPTLGGWHLGINRFSQHPELAWQLVAFLTSTEAQRRLAVEGGLKPTRISVYQDPTVVSGDPSLGFFFPLVQAARPRPVTPFYLMLSQVLQGELSAAVTGIKPAARALQDAERQLQRIFALDVVEDSGAQRVTP